MTPDRLRGETPFPEGGNGVSLKFINSKQAELQALFGDQWFTGAFDRISKIDVVFIFACIKAGAHKDGKPFVINIDSIGAPINEVAPKVLDALYISVHGQTFTEFAAEFVKAREAERLNGELPLAGLSPPETSSGN